MRCLQSPDGIQRPLVDCDAAGFPTGILREEAMQAVTSLIPEPSAAERRAALAAACAAALAAGVTAVGDMGRWPFAGE